MTTNILGEDPGDKVLLGPEISPDLASRWSSYLQIGLDKEARTKLFEGRHIPSNCPLLEAPKNNPEVQAMISHIDIKKDGFLMDLQNQLGKGITALGATVTRMLENTEQNSDPDENLTGLVEAGKMLCAVHHSISKHRKFFLYQNFNKKVQQVAAGQSRDSLLFGEDFGEKCKSAKNLETIANEMKASTSSYPKNSKSHASKSRWKQTESKRPTRRPNFNPSTSKAKPLFKTDRNKREK